MIYCNQKNLWFMKSVIHRPKLKTYWTNQWFMVDCVFSSLRSSLKIPADLRYGFVVHINLFVIRWSEIWICLRFVWWSGFVWDLNPTNFPMESCICRGVLSHVWLPRWPPPGQGQSTWLCTDTWIEPTIFSCWLLNEKKGEPPLEN